VLNTHYFNGLALPLVNVYVSIQCVIPPAGFPGPLETPLSHLEAPLPPEEDTPESTPPPSTQLPVHLTQFLWILILVIFF